MGTKRTYKAEAADQRAGMTIDELRQFMASIDGITNAHPKVRLAKGFSQGIRWIQVTEEDHDG